MNHHYQRMRKSRKAAAINFISQPFLIPLFNFPHKRPSFAFTAESGYTHSPSSTGAHTSAYTSKQGAVQLGVLSLPSERSTRCGNPAWPGVRTANFAAFGSWSETLPKDTESLRDSDVLMHVAVPRRRGPAGLRSPAAVVHRPPRLPAPVVPTRYGHWCVSRCRHLRHGGDAVLPR